MVYIENFVINFCLWDLLHRVEQNVKNRHFILNFHMHIGINNGIKAIKLLSLILLIFRN